MPTNRVCQLFERKLRHTKSASTLLYSNKSQSEAVLSQQSRPKSRDSLSVTVEYDFDRNPRHPTHPPPPPPIARTVNPHRASTTPLIHPPDELFLNMVRRRSANARLEQQITPVQEEPLDNDYYYRKGTLPTPVAIAYSIPPQYFDLPPEYESPQQMQRIWSPPPIRTRATIVKPRGAELFLDQELHIQIDEVIAEFGGFRLTEATPVHSSTPDVEDAPVSPINDIDTMYLERRAERKRHEREQRQQRRQSYLTTT